MKTSVVIPSYKHMNLLHQVLFDLYKHCRDSIDEIIVVDDASNDPDLDNYYVEGMMIKQLPVTVVKKVTNSGFLKTCNTGMQEASGDILILLSNDVRVQDDFVRQIKEEIEKDDRILIGNRFLEFDTGWNTFNGKIYPYLEGWLLACTKEIWEELGGFDERYAPNDMEDIDITTTAISKGIIPISLENNKIWHIGGQTLVFSPQREAITKRNKEKFREKWVK